MKTKKKPMEIIRGILAGLVAVFCCILTLCLLLALFCSSGTASQWLPEGSGDYTISEKITSLFSTAAQEAKEAAQSVTKIFWINEGDDPPVPNQDCYGKTTDPKSLQWLLDEAEDLLDGQDTLFTTETEILPGSEVNYYLDDSIMAITWKQDCGNFVYTISEIKVSHPSQFIRHLADDTFQSMKLYTTSQMASQVNGIVVASGDYFLCREWGIVVYDGIVRRVLSPRMADTCFVDYDGNLIMAHRGTFKDTKSVQDFVDENNISFSLAFGPILIENGVRCDPDFYALGEINDRYPRTALGQRGELHYVVVVATGESHYRSYQNIHTFASYLETFGCDSFYTLDGGQTGCIVMNNKQINEQHMDFQRQISDCIYFASAVPDEE